MTEEFKEKLLKLYPEFDKITGPYLRKDGRQHIILNNSKLSNGIKGKLKTLSYPKAVMEVHLGYLLNDLTIDHINKNPLDNEISNLQILSRRTHSSLDAKRRKEISGNCLQCNKKIILTRAQLDGRKAGPFCSRMCSGKYGAEVQNNKRLKLPGKICNIEYYTNKDLL